MCPSVSVWSGTLGTRSTAPPLAPDHLHQNYHFASLWPDSPDSPAHGTVVKLRGMRRDAFSG